MQEFLKLKLFSFKRLSRFKGEYTNYDLGHVQMPELISREIYGYEMVENKCKCNLIVLLINFLKMVGSILPT